jgi:hypothetical protein|tara:strand:+ start:428 stop:628 length:201 start_codon:yes stop_codon:yes gene_type:complete
MDNKTLEELIYEFGQVLYRIGRLETDGKDTQKDYNKQVKRKEELMNLFEDHFKSPNKKLSQSLGIF